jgi:hypothetical protein
MSTEKLEQWAPFRPKINSKNGCWRQQNLLLKPNVSIFKLGRINRISIIFFISSFRDGRKKIPKNPVDPV